MKRTNAERSYVMQSNRTSTLALWVVVVFVVGSVAGAQPAAATHIPGISFLDDFSDMNISDGMPVSWSPGGQGGQVLDPSSGDLRLLLLGAGRCTFLLADDFGSHTGYQDFSARTQIRLLLVTDSGGFFNDGAGFLVRAAGGFTGYMALVGPNGDALISRLNPFPSRPSITLLASIPTGLDPINNDVHLQFDVFGDTLALTVWADGSPEPAMPQLTVTDATYAEGRLGVCGTFPSPSDTVFRFVDVRVPPEIDIKPGSDTNPINIKNPSIVPVAILGSEEFDVLTVDPATVCFGADPPDPFRSDCTENHERGHDDEDVDSDGYLDLVMHFDQNETRIHPGRTEACLTGETFDGESFRGCDFVQVALCGIGFELAFILPPLMWLRGRRRRSVLRS